MKLKTLSAALALGLALPHAVVNALEIRTIENAQGRTVFEVRFFDVNDGMYADGEQSFWSWNQAYQDHIMGGLAYWAEIIQPQGSNPPSIINIGTNNAVGNAFGGAPEAYVGNSAFSVLQQNVQGMSVSPDDLAYGAHGFFGLGPSDYNDRYTLTQTPLGGKDDVFNTAIHELAHGFGLLSSVSNPDELSSEDEDKVLPRFDDKLGSWAKLLVDDNRRPARPGQVVLCNGCDNPYDPDGFDVRRDDAYLVGSHIAEVMQGAMPGVPVKMLSLSGGEYFVDDNYMSHIELRNSMMSHQNYRNYTAFMEAELALLQDIGYTIDRANFFGRSIYGDHLNIVNTQGFYARNATGTAYLPGQYNTASLGLGLHIYGSHNRVKQTADLLAIGPGGTGVRVDGEDNALTIDPNVRLYGNGLYGQGIQFAYGRNHTLNHRGDIEALGQNGVGIRFDFGANSLGNQTEYRGSWIRTISGQIAELLPELRGSLVKQADISGRVAGRDAAIYIGDSAHVGQINLMSGAIIQGDIVSHYNQHDENNQLRLTTVSFGKKADVQGYATQASDPNFKFSYTDSILGDKNLTLAFEGGETQLSGKYVVHGAVVKPAAVLSGTARFELPAGTELVNSGTIAPGNSIGQMNVVGDYRQTNTGTLQAEFNASGTHDVMSVSGRTALAGTLALTPEADWYNSTWSVTTGPLIESPTIEGDFETVQVVSSSPTLNFQAEPATDQRWNLTASRTQDAYSQYADTSNRVAVGQALHAIADAGSPVSQNLFRLLDFSAPDGSAIASTLTQASPEGYSALAAASLQRDRDVMSAARQSFGQGINHSDTTWKGFALGFGGEGDQKTRDTQVGYRATTYGVVVGGGRALASNPAASTGIYLDISEQSVNLRNPLNGKGKSTALGLGGLLTYQPDPLVGIHAHGGLRVGIEDGDMKRRVSVDSYSTTHRADWTGKSIAIDAGTGYQFKLLPTLSAGPFANLAYAHASRPSINESGDQATRLNLNRQSLDALRSSLGINAIWRQTLTNGSGIDARAFASWDRELLDRNLNQTAQFDALSSQSFSTKNAILPRNTASVGVGVTWRRTESLSVGFDINGRAGNGYKAMEGRLNMSWAF